MDLKNLKNIIKRAVREAKEYPKRVREIERILKLSPVRLIWGIEEGYWPWGIEIFFKPIIWSSKENCLKVAIHEVRHRLQVKYKVNLLSLNDLKTIEPSLRKEIEKSIQPLEREKNSIIYFEEEIDARIVEIIGERLFKAGQIEDFKNLMLHSIVPEFFQEPLKISGHFYYSFSSTLLTYSPVSVFISIMSPC